MKRTMATTTTTRTTTTKAELKWKSSRRVRNAENGLWGENAVQAREA